MTVGSCRETSHEECTNLCTLKTHQSKQNKLDRSFVSLDTTSLAMFNTITFQPLEKWANINAKFMESALRNNSAKKWFRVKFKDSLENMWSLFLTSTIMMFHTLNIASCWASFRWLSFKKILRFLLLLGYLWPLQAPRLANQGASPKMGSPGSWNSRTPERYPWKTPMKNTWMSQKKLGSMVGKWVITYL